MAPRRGDNYDDADAALSGEPSINLLLGAAATGRIFEYKGAMLASFRVNVMAGIVDDECAADVGWDRTRLVAAAPCILCT